MTVLLVTNNYPPGLGGVSRYYEGLVGASHGRIKVVGVDVPESFPSRSGLKGRLLEMVHARGISRAYRREYAILAGQPHLAIGSMLAGVPFGLMLHGGEWQDYPKGQSMLNRVLSRAKVIGCNSHATRDEWIPASLHEKVLVIHPGTPSFAAEGSPAHSERSGVPFRILAVSRLSPRKGLDRLIQAVQLCISRGLDLSLDIVGEGPEWDRLSALVTMPDRIALRGRVDDSSLRDYYETADMFALLPHRIAGGEAWEGYGIVFLEAASFGLPILATRSGGVEEALAVEGSVALDEDCSTAEVAAHIRSLVEDRARRGHMSEVNRDWALSQVWASRSDLVDELVNQLEASRQ